jgi:predicted nucleotidyltransferase
MAPPRTFRNSPRIAEHSRVLVSADVAGGSTATVVGAFGSVTMAPMSSETSQATAMIAAVAARHPGLSLMVVFGSRARGDATDRSDWDLGYLAGEHVDPDAILADLVSAIGTERIDLVDLSRASGLVRFRAARDGVAIVEKPRGAFDRFWLDAVSFWCEAGHVLRAAYAGVLDELGT